MMRLRGWLMVALMALHGVAAAQDEPTEYRVKAAFLYNFAVLTQWPADVGPALALCVHGDDPFGAELDELERKPVGARRIVLRRRVARDALAGCQLVFVARSAAASLPQVRDALRGRAVLVVADAPGAAQQGAAINLLERESRVGFEVNLRAAQGAGLALSSKLLRLAREVLQ